MVKIVVFGDSFSNIFLTLKSFGVIIYKFKGATIRGLLNKNENYYKILSILENNQFDIGIFIFGFVDLNFYYYHKTYKTDNQDIFNMILSYSKDYVNFISSLPNIKKKVIISVMPSPVDNINFIKSIIMYGSLNENDVKKIDQIDYDIYTRNNRIFDFNIQLEKYAKQSNIYCCNQYYNLIDSKYNIYEIFKLPHNKFNIHINFEYMFIYLLNTCMRFLLKYFNYNLIVKKAKHNYDEYLLNKSKQYEFSYNDNTFNIIKINKFIKEIKNKK
jgi:hypothetical protein